MFGYLLALAVLRWRCLCTRGFLKVSQGGFHERVWDAHLPVVGEFKDVCDKNAHHTLTIVSFLEDVPILDGATGPQLFRDLKGLATDMLNAAAATHICQSPVLGFSLGPKLLAPCKVGHV